MTFHSYVHLYGVDQENNVKQSVIDLTHFPDNARPINKAPC